MTRAWLFALCVVGCDPGLPTATVQVGTATLLVEIAHTEEARRQGLMKRDHLAEDRGMLFVYTDSALRGFWMKDTKIPLSIAFLDEAGTIRRITDMRPFATDRVPSLYPARYALEVNQGWFERHGVGVGDAVSGLGQLPTASAEAP